MSGEIKREKIYMITMRKGRLRRYVRYKAEEKELDILLSPRGAAFCESDKALWKMGEVMADAVMECACPAYLGEYIKNKYPKISLETRAQVIMSALGRLWCMSEKQTEIYKNKIKRRFLRCLEENSELDFYGFIDFRLKDYVLSWKRCADSLMEKAAAEEERLRCLERLKLYLSSRRAESEALCVDDTDEGFMLYEKDSALKNFVSDINDVIKAIIEKRPRRVIYRKAGDGQTALLLAFLLGEKLLIIDNDLP